MKNMNLDALIHGYVEERVSEAKEKLVSFKTFANVLEEVFNNNKELAGQIYTVSMYQMLINPEWSENDLIEWFVTNLEPMNK